MKRLVLLMAGFMVGTAAFAVDFNIGAGLDFSDALTRVTDSPAGSDDQTANWVVNSFGGFLFFDAAYAELDVSFSGQSGLFPLGNGYISPNDYPVSTTSIGFALLGKYPIKVGSLTLFPLLGVDYKLVVAAKSRFGDDITDGNRGTNARGARGVVYYNGIYENGKLSDFSNLWLKAGFGGDFSLNASWSLRSEYLYGIQLMNTAQTKSFAYNNTGDKKEALLTNGMTFKLAVAYRIGGTKTEAKK
jgi:hypothetical protein